MANKIDYKQKFIRFLKAKNAYEAFIYNINHSSHLQVADMFNLHSPDLFVLQAFDWGYGDEGINYWFKLHKQWCEVLKDLNLSFK